jgi:DMSO/TMAO reductase YedYZ heme-binding membrane subunit
LFFSVIYFFITGLLFSYFESVVRKMFMDKNRILAFLIIILLVLHIVYAFEYNMRSAIRYFYYAFFILLMRYLYVQIKKNLPKLK